MKSLISGLGLLRAMLYAAGLLVVIFSPSPGMQVDLEWPAVLTTVVVPALAPIIFMVILFDLVMLRIIARGVHDDSPPPAPYFLWVGAGLAFVILLKWLPYLLSLSE